MHLSVALWAIVCQESASFQIKIRVVFTLPPLGVNLAWQYPASPVFGAPQMGFFDKLDDPQPSASWISNGAFSYWRQ
jgi:hypothetical protein